MPEAPEPASVPPHPIFREGGDQLTMLMTILDAMPTQLDGVMTGIFPSVRKKWAEQLMRRGVVVDVAQMRELPAAGGEHPEAAWLNPTSWLPLAEYAKRQASGSPDTAAHTEQMRAMLEAIDPDRAARIDAMSPEEKAAEAARLAPEVPQGIERLHALGRQFIEQQQAARKAAE